MRTYEHGNRKPNPAAAPNSHLFFSASAELKDKIKKAVQKSSNHVRSSVELKKEIRLDPNMCLNENIDLPRDLRTFQNFRAAQIKKFQVTGDDLLNLCALDNTLKHFIKFVAVRPDLQIHLFHPQAVALAKKLQTKETLMLSYDTTFNFGDYYLSMISTKNLHFIEEPLWPILFFIHERRFAQRHKKFFEDCVAKVIDLNKAGITSDREFGIIKTIADLITNCKEASKLVQFYSTNHIVQDVKIWTLKQAKKLKKKEKKDGEADPIDKLIDQLSGDEEPDSNLFKKAEKLVEEENKEEPELEAKERCSQLSREEQLRKLKEFRSNVYLITRSESAEELEETIAEFSKSWTPDCSTYFFKNIKPALDLNMQPEKKKYLDHFKGLPESNLSESLNSMVPRFFRSRTKKLDALTLGLFEMQVEYLDRFNASYRGTGQYTLKKKYAGLRDFKLEIDDDLRLDFESEIIATKKALQSVEDEEGDEAAAVNSRSYLAEMIVKKNLIQPVESTKGYYVVKFPNSVKSKCTTKKKGKNTDQPLEQLTVASIDNCQCAFYQKTKLKCVHMMATEFLETGDIESDKIGSVNRLEKALKKSKSGKKGPEEFEFRGEKQLWKPNEPSSSSQHDYQQQLDFEDELSDLNWSDDEYQPKNAKTSCVVEEESDPGDQVHPVQACSLGDLKSAVIEEVFVGDDGKRISADDSISSYHDWLSSGITDKSLLNDDHIFTFLKEMKSRYSNHDTLIIPATEQRNHDTLVKYIFHYLTPSINKVFVVVHKPGGIGHWFSGLIKLDTDEIYIYDSIKTTLGVYIVDFQHLFMIRNVIHRIRNQAQVIIPGFLAESDFNFFVIKNGPVQPNGRDCRVFVCLFSLENFSRGRNGQTVASHDSVEYRKEIRKVIKNASEVPQNEKRERRIPSSLKNLEATNFFSHFDSLKINVRSHDYNDKSFYR